MDSSETLCIAEEYLNEMLAADQKGDYDAFIQRFETIERGEFTKAVFLNDIQCMREELGEYQDRIFLGSLNSKCKSGE